MELTFSAEHLAHIDRQLKLLADGRVTHAGDPRMWEIDYNEALVYLSVGRFTEGWDLFASRFSLPDAKFSYDHFPVDRWDGGSLQGKNVFVWLEQGIGDQIMCASMLKELQQAVTPGSVTLLCDRVLYKTFTRAFPGIAIHRTGGYLSQRLEAWDFDCQLSLADLGKMFRNSWADFPGRPYLVPNPAKVAEYRAKYKTGKKLCGVAWCSISKTTGPEKSMTLIDMAPILKRDDFTFLDMQYGDHIPELKAAWSAGLNIMHDKSVDQLCDMDDFIAQVAAMDVVITTSQTLAHVAGAVGVPTYVLLPLGKGRLWYWFAEVSECPWYHAVTLLRQKVLGDWTAPIEAAGAVLDGIIAHKEPTCLTA